MTGSAPAELLNPPPLNSNEYTVFCSEAPALNTEKIRIVNWHIN